MTATGANMEGVLILGAPRSGTTLLRRLFDRHPRFACPGETYVFTACGRFLRSERIADGVGIGVLDGLSYAGFSSQEVLARLRELAFSFHREYAARQGKARWAAKTAFDAFYVQEIEQLCGDHAAFVCIQRHGLDVACSIQELCDKNGVYLKELHEYIIRYPRPLDAFAHAWVDLTEALNRFVERHPRNAIVIRYEDLTENPDDTMSRVMAFLGESWEPGQAAQALSSPSSLGLGDWKTYGLQSVERSSVGRWKQLPRETLSRLAAICNPTLQACGYEPLALEEETPPEDARRRYKLGLLLQRLKPGGSSRAAGRVSEEHAKTNEPRS